MSIVATVILLKQFQPIISLSNYIVLSVILTIIIIALFEIKSKNSNTFITKKQEPKTSSKPSNMNIMGENKDTIFFNSPDNEIKSTEVIAEQSVIQNDTKTTSQTNEILEERQVVKSVSGFHVDGELPNLDDLTDKDFDVIIFEDEIEEDFYEKESLDILEIKKKFEAGETLSTDEQTIIDTFFKTEEEWKESGEIIIQTTHNANIDFELKSEILEDTNQIKNTIESSVFEQKPNNFSNENVQFTEEIESKSIFEEYLK